MADDTGRSSYTGYDAQIETGQIPSLRVGHLRGPVAAIAGDERGAGVVRPSRHWPKRVGRHRPVVAARIARGCYVHAVASCRVHHLDREIALPGHQAGNQAIRATQPLVITEYSESRRNLPLDAAAIQQHTVLGDNLPSREISGHRRS